jgi:hypothetical protein
MTEAAAGIKVNTRNFFKPEGNCRGSSLSRHARQGTYSAASRRTATPRAFTTTLIASSTRSFA